MRIPQFFCILLVFVSLTNAGRAQQIAAPAPPAAGAIAAGSGAAGGDSVPDAPGALGTIDGTVTDVYDDIIPGATVLLEGATAGDRRTVVSDGNGFFIFKDLKPGISYTVSISSPGFAKWTSPAEILKPGQDIIVTGIALKIEEAVTTVNAVVNTEEIAVQQVQLEERQRVLGFIPNFYVVYDHNAVPLTTKLKFQLAFKSSTDPVTFLGSVFLASLNQAADTPDYKQGWKGYGQRVGAVYADGLTDIMFGGAILPSLLHQDPRYFYQGTGSHKSRALHAIYSEFICKGDNGSWQPNYSSVGGDLISGALSETYYPTSNRGVGLVANVFLTDTAARIASNLIQEFVLRKFTSNSH